MKNLRLYLFAITILLGACKQTAQKGEEKAAHHDAKNKNIMMQAMDDSMLAMHKAKQTGNADYDFAAMMIPHHEGAIVMAEALIKQGKSRTLINFGEKVIVAQNAEIEILKNFLKTAVQTPSENPEKFKIALNNSMQPMMDGMAEVTLNGNADHDFSVLMIPHHQSAVNMAKAYLPYAKHPQIKKMAEEIIKAQESEIKWLKEQK
jgi:uncharacterized protein (DUF305 family)